MKKIAIIGSGFSGLSSACYLAKAGNDVTIYEKNDTVGGRARQLKHEGFTFDIGPTFYWMPDVFDKFFADFGKKTNDYYELVRLDPGYEVYFGKDDTIEISANLEKLYESFEKEEKGSSRFLKKFLSMAGFNYKASMEKVIYKPGKSPFELITPATVSRVGQFTKTISQTIRRNIKSPKLIKILEFPVIFLGAKPQNIPAFYCFMNYADMVLGTWHPKKGMYEVIKGMKSLAVELGVKIETSSAVEKILVEQNVATSLQVNGKQHCFDYVVTGADYHHSETLLDEQYRNYSEAYWDKKVFAPSVLMFYVGFNKKLKNVKHHTLFFDTDFDSHIDTVFGNKSWPTDPVFYASFPSITDETVAPKGKEAGIFLIPLAPGLNDTKEIREAYFQELIERIEKLTDQSIDDAILFKKSYCVSDFIKDYNAYKGNAYGLANTLMQTAFLKPKMENKKVKNLIYTGQLTVPGPGVPTNIISGKIAAGLVK